MFTAITMYIGQKVDPVHYVSKLMLRYAALFMLIVDICWTVTVVKLAWWFLTA